MASRAHPLPLEATLRDLALMRACDIDFSGLVTDVKTPVTADPAQARGTSDVDKSVDRSYEFVRQARAALKILNREEVEKQGQRIDGVRSTLEDVQKGLS